MTKFCLRSPTMKKYFFSAFKTPVKPLLESLLYYYGFAIWPEIFAFSFRSCSEKILLFVRRPGFQVWLGFGQSSSWVSEAPNAQGILGKVASTICRNCLSWLQRGKNQHESLQNIWKSPKKKFWKAKISLSCLKLLHLKIETLCFCAVVVKKILSMKLTFIVSNSWSV